MDKTLIEKTLLDISKEQSATTVCIKEIQKDLKYHIKRTDQNEISIDVLEKEQQAESRYTRKHIYIVKGAIGLLVLIGIIAGILARLNGLG